MNNQISKAGRVKEQAIKLFAWLSVVLSATGLLFKAGNFPGGAPLMIFGYISFAFLFVPLYFFTNRKISNPFVSRRFKVFLGFTFWFIFSGSIFKIHHYPGATLLTLIGNVGLLVIVPKLIRANANFKIREPLYAGLLAGVFFLGAYQFSAQILRNNQTDLILKPYSNFEKLNQELISLSERPKVFDKIKALKAELISNTEEIPIEVADTLSVYNIAALDNWDIPTNYLFTEKNEQNPILKEFWNSIRFDLEQASASSFNLEMLTRFNENEMKLVDDLFLFKQLGVVLLNLERLKNLILIGQNAQSEDKLIKYVINQSIAEHNELEQLNVAYSDRIKEVGQEFFGMFFLSFIVAVFFFYIPTLKISDTWKIRLVLLSLVILFEFVLLIADQLISMNSNNLYLMLSANILLAIGLVWLDGFVRTRLLSWYED